MGVDLNPEMLAVARQKASEVEWLEAPAELLPLDSDRFDAVLSQFGLMFFEEKQAAIRENVAGPSARRPPGHCRLGFTREHTRVCRDHVPSGSPFR